MALIVENSKQEKDKEEIKHDFYRAAAEENLHSVNDSDTSEEIIDDEIYLKRHYNLELEEIQRYNIGIMDKKSVLPV